MRRVWLAVLGVLAASPAWAVNQPFSYALSAATLTRGQFEFDQSAAGRFQSGFNDYAAADLSTSLAWGITSNFQFALLADTGYLHATGTADAVGAASHFPTDTWYFQGLAAQFTYQIFNPDKDGLGLALTAMPEWKPRDPFNAQPYDGALGLQFRTALQKNLARNRLIFIYNVGLETQSLRYKPGPRKHPVGPKYEGELDVENDAGLAFRVTREFAAGIELRNEIADVSHSALTTLWVGPSLNFNSGPVWATLGYLEQVYRSAPSNLDIHLPVGDDLGLRGQQRHAIMLKVGIPF